MNRLLLYLWVVVATLLMLLDAYLFRVHHNPLFVLGALGFFISALGALTILLNSEVDKQ